MRRIPDGAIERLKRVGRPEGIDEIGYRLVEEIGRGGMGVVYAAEDARLGRRVALKVLDTPDEAGELEARLIREARVLAQLEHPGIVPVHDVGHLKDGRLFYTMKLVRGQRLDEYLASGPSLPERLRLFVRICEAVAFAHDRGVLHRDLKPANIMVGAFGEVMVMDWGVAKVLRMAEPGPTPSGGATGVAGRDVAVSPDDELTEAGSIMGTPGYMAPEQARGEVDSLDERADVFSLGAVLAAVLEAGQASSEATTLTLPESGPPSPGRRPPAASPKRLRAIVSKARAERRGARYESALELAADVERYLDGGSVSALPEGLWTRIARFLSNHRVAVVLILVYAIVRTLVLLFAGR